MSTIRDRCNGKRPAVRSSSLRKSKSNPALWAMRGSVCPKKAKNSLAISAKVGFAYQVGPSKAVDLGSVQRHFPAGVDQPVEGATSW